MTSPAMTPEDVARWLAAMKAAGLARSGRAACGLLGITVNTMQKMKADGADRRTALACAALLAGLGPYGEEEGGDGTEGQDRESYSDGQDRDGYSVGA